MFSAHPRSASESPGLRDSEQHRGIGRFAAWWVTAAYKAKRSSDRIRDELNSSHLGLAPVVTDAARVAQRLGSVGPVAPQRRGLRVAVRASLAGDAR